MSALMRAPRRHSTRSPDRQWLRRVAWVTAAVVGFVASFAYNYVGTLTSQINTGDVTLLVGPDRVQPPPADEAHGQYVNILLMGSDARDGANGDIGGNFGGMRNDTTIIMHISADRTRVQFISIPRDSYVAIPDCWLADGTRVPGYTAKFNVAFANGGRDGDVFAAAACTIRAVESLTGIPIQHFAVVDFTGFIDVIDALGGVPMCIPGEIYSSKAKLHLYPGPQILNGTTALAWARLRTAEIGERWVNGSDLTRIDRQQELLSHTIETALAQNVFTSFGTLTNFVEAGAASLSTDPQLADSRFLIPLLWSLRNVEPENIVFTTVPNRYIHDFLDVEWTPAAYTMFDDIYWDRPISGTSVAAASDAGEGGTPAPGATPGGQLSDEDLLNLVSACPTS